MNVAVAPTKFAKGFDGTGREVPDAYEIVDLRAALERVYTTDAHLVTYVVEGAAHQPRLNKPGLPYFDRQVLTTAFFCDVDNPEHGEWTDELLERASIQTESLDVLRTCGIYHTAHGRRIVQPLESPIPVTKVEPYLRRWLLALESDGLAVDWACRDWTRHFRLPHVKRNGRMYQSPVVDLDNMVPIALDPIADEETAPAIEPGRSKQRAPAPTIAWSNDLPPNWEQCATAVARAIRASVSEGWHTMYLALGGALLSRGCPPERLPAVVLWIASLAASSKPWSHHDSARNTANRYASGLEVTGHRRLREKWPAVADALDDATATRTEARLREQTRAAPDAPPLAEALKALRAAIRDAPDGLTVLSAECGMGKTHAAIDVAAERAGKTHKSPSAAGLRAPAGSKTSISVDKNALAIQVTNDLRARGVPTRRIFGPLSVLQDDGTPVCKFHDFARPLVEGGQPMRWELCRGRDRQPCPHYDTCPARDGIDGPQHARVTVGPHSLVAELSAEAGSLGLLVVDEPPSAIESIVLTRDDFVHARARFMSFESRYQKGMRPALDAFERWIDVAEGREAMAPLDAVREAGASAADVVDAAMKALPDDRASRAPPILRQEIFVAMRSLGYAAALGAGSKVLATLHRLMTSTDPAVVRVEQRADLATLVVTAPRDDFSKALRREGAVVVTDANAEIHLPILEKIVGYAPRFHRFSAPDGAPITRTLLRCRTATRRGWFSQGRVVLDAGVESALRAAVSWVREDTACRRVGLITMHLLRLLLEAAARPDDALLTSNWRALGQPEGALDEAKDKLGPILRELPGEIVFGHYGAVRGLNTMADVDALVTLGDPWPNLGEVKNDVAFLGLTAPWEKRIDALCRAELEQAHGRLRTVHRTRTGRALHVGGVVPSGYGWTSGAVDFRRMARGPLPAESSVDAETVESLVKAVGGVRAAARTVGCAPITISRYVSGQRPIPSVVSGTLARAALPTR
jgi:hypothetical protein